MDKATQHYKTDIVTEYLLANRRTLRVRWIPTASPEFNMLEECWREGEKDLCRLPVFPTTKEGAEIDPGRILSNEKILLTPIHEEIPSDKERVYELMTARLAHI